MTAVIGFTVPAWRSKHMSEYTNEELLEYWHKLRTVTKSGPVDTSDYGRKGLGTDFVIVDLQDEILRRMGGK